MESNFSWIDLSTFDVGKAKEFYGRVFGWEFDASEGGYINSRLFDGPAAGLYEMPEFFQSIKMPSFWMTYISVTDIKGIVAKAAELGGKLELEDDDSRGKVALIRDPAGAGFTCYEGNLLSAERNFNSMGRWC